MTALRASWRASPALWSALALLTAAAASAPLYYFFIAQRWWLWELLGRPRRQLAFLVRYDWDDVALFGLLVGGLFALYGLACWGAARRGPRWLDALSFLLAALLGLALLPAYPLTSNDVFHYIMGGRIFWLHGGNPLVDTPIQYSWDPYLFYSDWVASPSPYGPAWILSLWLPQRLPQGDPATVVLTYKGFVLALHLLTGLAVWLLAGRLAPQRQRLAATIYTWNPLLLFTVAVDGHNDVLMMLLAVLALYFALGQRWWLAFPAAVLSALSKYVTLLLLPLLLHYGWQRTARGGRPGLLLGLALGVGAGVAAMAPFWQGLDTFRALAQDDRSWLFVSLSETLYFGLNDLLPRPEAITAARAVSSALFLGPYLLLLWQLKGEGEQLVRACYHALLFYLLIALGIFNPWYITWVMALAAPLADRAALVGAAFTLLGFLGAHRGPTLLLNFQRHWGVGPGRPLMAAVLFLPVAALWLALEGRRLWRGLRWAEKSLSPAEANRSVLRYFNVGGPFRWGRWRP
jgi:alpha-1,6-mannosyltransferase